MDFALSEEQRLFRDEIVRFARDTLNRNVVERDHGHTFPHDLWVKCGEMGLQGLPVPEAYGGSGLDPLSTAIALDGLGYGCEDSGLSFSICAHVLACVVPLMHHGSEEQKRQYLPRLCSGELIAVNAMSEAGSGSDAYRMKTRALRDGEGYVISGAKIWSTNSTVADLAIVYAMTDPEKGYYGGTSVFLVESVSPGFVRGQTFDKMGLRTSPIGEIILNDVRVPATALLGEEGAGTSLFTQSMEWERVCIASLHCGTLERLIERSIEYARQREAFGQPISNYEAISNKIVDMKIRLEGARLLTYQAAMRLDVSREVAVDACMAKVFVSEALVQSALDAIQIFGGNGYTVDYGIERVLRDAIGGKIYSGTNEVQRNMLAKWLGI